MSAAQQAMPWGAKNGDRRPDWETPTVLFREIERRYAHGGAFTVDVCAAAHNAKCERFLTEEQDCLKTPWGEVASGEVAWLQPPFDDIGPFVARAVEQLDQHRIDQCVAFIPARSDRRWWHEIVLRRGVLIPVQGRCSFVTPPGWEPSQGSMLSKRGFLEAHGGKPGSHAEPMAIVLFERPLYLPDWCAAREPDFVDGLLAVRAELAAEGVTADPLQLIAELGR